MELPARRKLRIAVVGTGVWGINHVRVIASDASCELAGIVDPDPAALARASEISHGVPRTCDADQVFADPDVDAVVLATPAATHASLAIAAFRAHKHVMIEKPLALNTRDALAVATAARENQRVGMVGHLMVHHPGVVRIREMLHSGALGRMHYLHSTRVNLGRLRHDESALWSFGPHDLSMIEFLLGRQPHTVSARGQCVLQPEIEDVVFLTLRYPTGELAHVHLSWLSPRKERRLTLVCSQKMVELDDVASDKLRVYDKGYDRPREFTEYGQYLTIRDGDVHIPQLSMEEPLRLQLQHFIRCIHERNVPTASLESGVRIVAILEAAQESLRRDGTPVELKECGRLPEAP